MTGLSILELRRYALRPGARDTLVELFDREFVESQEALGARLLGQFRDLDDPDSFVWLRAFANMVERRRALEAFYTSDLWRTHAAAANATMVAVDNVLLLRPLRPLTLDGLVRAPAGAAAPPGLLAVTVYPLAHGQAAAFPDGFDRRVAPVLAAAGAEVLATYATEHSVNDYPGLPVREDVDAFVWLALFADEGAHARAVAAYERDPRREEVAAWLLPRLDGPVEALRLRPTTRSLLHA